MFIEFTISFNIKEFYTFPTERISVFCMNVKETAILFLYSTDWLVAVAETECVYSAVRSEYV